MIAKVMAPPSLRVGDRVLTADGKFARIIALKNDGFDSPVHYDLQLEGHPAQSVAYNNLLVVVR